MLVVCGRGLVLPSTSFTPPAIDRLVDLGGPCTSGIIVCASATCWSMLVALLSALATCVQSASADLCQGILNLTWKTAGFGAQPRGGLGDHGCQGKAGERFAGRQTPR